jgi:fatty-acyl-CoA synthase
MHAPDLTTALASVADEVHHGLRFLDRHGRPEQHPWSQIVARARAVAGHLRATGLEPGEHVALVYPTGPDFFDAFFGVLLAGAVPVPLYPPVRLGRLDEYHPRTAKMIAGSRAVLVLTDSTIRRLLGPSIEASRPRMGALLLEDLTQGNPIHEDASPDQLGLVQFSSGTTGSPKAVALTHGALMAQTHALQSVMLDAYPESDTLQHSGCSWLPLYHDMGLIGCVFPALVHAASLTLIRPEHFIARPVTWLRALSDHRATISVAPNFAYALCTDRIQDEEMEGVDLSHWRIGLNGAEPVAPSTLDAFVLRFARWGLRPETLSPVYGLSEAALAITFSDLRKERVTRHYDREDLATKGQASPSEEGRAHVSVGRPLPGFDVEVRGEAHHPLPERHLGHIWARGPSVMQGYLNDPEATLDAVREGWLKTGDLGFFDRGELFVTGREKDLLILRGRNHEPQGIEEAVEHVNGTRKGCAAAVSTRQEGCATETLLLFIETPRKGGKPDATSLADRCTKAVLEQVGLLVDQVVVLPAGTLPRTSSGKIRRAETLTRYLNDTLRPPEPVGWWRMTRHLVRSARALRRARSS